VVNVKGGKAGIIGHISFDISHFPFGNQQSRLF
jgi:hypothetical protein